MASVQPSIILLSFSLLRVFSGNELNSDIVLGLVILIITLLALPRFRQVELALELIFEAVRTLLRIVVLFQQLIRDLHQIISMAHDGFQKVYLVLKLLFEAVQTLVRIVVLLQQLIWDLHQIMSMARDGFPQVVSVLELIDDAIRSLISLVDQLKRLIRTCREIWSIWTAGEPAAVANEHQNEVPPTDAEAADAANGHNE